MNTPSFSTFSIQVQAAVAWITFDDPPVNIQGLKMLAELNRLAEHLEQDRTIRVVVFQSAHPEIFVAHADTFFLKDMPTTAVARDEVQLLDLQTTLDRISRLPQATIAKIEGYACGGGHEFALACDMRFAARGKAVFMQMEVAMGILPCGGGASRLPRQVGLGRALEIVLGAEDFDADTAAAYGTINKALDPDEIGPYVTALAQRIARWPAASIEACKRAVYAAADLPLMEALREEAYQLYQALSQTPAQKRFQHADDTGAQFDMNNQRNWQTLLPALQEIQ